MYLGMSRTSRNRTLSPIKEAANGCNQKGFVGNISNISTAPALVISM
jgi:hypothetical protein